MFNKSEISNEDQNSSDRNVLPQNMQQSLGHNALNQGAQETMCVSQQDDTENSGACGGLPKNLNHNWQSTKTTVKERFAFMFNNELLSDVHFILGQGSQQQRIPAHKFVLAVGSAVFDAMFNGPLATRDQDIELPDLEIPAFLALLKFIYSDEVQIGPETVMATLYAAKKYSVPALERHCVDFLKSNLRADNAFMLLMQARLFDEASLASVCLEMIDKNTLEALSADGFLDINLDTLKAFLRRDSLHVREIKIYQALIKWGKAECDRQLISPSTENLRLVLESVLQLVRFPLMSVEEFANEPAQSGILTDREIVSLFLHFTLSPKPTTNFSDKPRCSMTGSEFSVNRFLHVDSRWGYSGTSDRIRFLVDRRIFIVGLGLYGSLHGPTEYEVTIQIIHTASGNSCTRHQTTLSCDGNSEIYKVMLHEAVEILSNTTYTASVTMQGPDSLYGTSGQRRVVVDYPQEGKVTFQFSYASGNNNGTSVEDGQIPEILFYI